MEGIVLTGGTGKLFYPITKGLSKQYFPIYDKPIVQVFDCGFAWPDNGTHYSVAEANTFVKVIEKRKGLKVASLEGIDYRKDWVNEENMCELAKPMLKNQYGQYLLKVIDEMKEEINSNTLQYV